MLIRSDGPPQDGFAVANLASRWRNRDGSEAVIPYLFVLRHRLILAYSESSRGTETKLLWM
jgi:hypothetical protein